MAGTALSAAHERGKQRRRRAILDAARDIIMRSGEAAMTMRTLAAQAGVSPATPYNLFGSKHAILQAVYDQDLETFAGYFADRASADALIRIFDLMDITIAYFQRDPDFYRALFSTLQRNSGSELGSRAWSVRMDYLRSLVSDGIAAGELRADTPVDLVAASLVRLFKAIGQEWVDGSMTLDAAGRELGTSFLLVLASLVTSSGMPSLTAVQQRYA